MFLLEDMSISKSFSHISTPKRTATIKLLFEPCRIKCFSTEKIQRNKLWTGQKPLTELEKQGVNSSLSLLDEQK